MSRKFEKTFVVNVPIARAWRAFAETEERSRWEADPFEIEARPGGKVRWELPGIETKGRVLEVEPQRLLRHAEESGPHAGQEVTVTFEEVEGGTRIHITHAGFGDGAEFDDALEATQLGWSMAIADLIVYLETGVAPERFFNVWVDPGVDFVQTPGALRVAAVRPEGLGASAGLEPGDLLIFLDGKPIYTRPELQPILRGVRSGDKVPVAWVRGGQRMEATAGAP